MFVATPYLNEDDKGNKSGRGGRTGTSSDGVSEYWCKIKIYKVVIFLKLYSCSIRK